LTLTALVSTVTSAVRRPVSYQSRLYRQQSVSFRTVLFLYFALHQRSGTDYRKLPYEDRPYLRNFVQTRAAEECTYTGYSRIVVYLVLTLILLKLFGRKHIFQFVRILLHRAELRNAYRLTVLADALMKIEHFTSVACLDQHGNK